MPKRKVQQGTVTFRDRYTVEQREDMFVVYDQFLEDTCLYHPPFRHYSEARKASHDLNNEHLQLLQWSLIAAEAEIQIELEF